MRVGCDTGGTFTDFVMVADGAVRVHKVLSTPDDPSRAVEEGLHALAGDDLGRVDLTHGSTVGTNALLERRGARCALVTTAGFEDLIEIGRQNRPHLYELRVEKPPALVERAARFGVAERVGAGGEILTPLDDEEVAAVAARLANGALESVAVCLLFSYLAPEHEERIGAALERAGLQVSLSSRILPEHREYERMTTTLANAYISPVVGSYLRRLAGRIRCRALRVMQSNGGTVGVETGASLAVRTVLSGPAGGAIGAFETARRAGFERVVTFDMGGTSTDVSLADGRLRAASETTVGGIPIRAGALDIHTVGAGGGSIAWIDAGGALEVGPRSAGADPGPACYGKGSEATVTDANLVLGRLHGGSFLGGRMSLDEGRARAAIEAVARRMGAPATEAALGIVAVVESAMERAVRVISVERGHDPQRFALLSFGGAGGQHACGLARRLRIGTVLVPCHPGTLSALGMVVADVGRDYSASLLARAVETSDAELESRFADLVSRARNDLGAEGIDAERIAIERRADLRYLGQSYEVTVDAPAGGGLLARCAEAFHARHRDLYGHASPGRPLEVVAVRVRGIGRLDRPEPGRLEPAAESRPRSRGIVAIRFAHGAEEAARYDRVDLAPGHLLDGPALVTEPTATTLVPPGWSGRVDAYGNLILEDEAAGSRIAGRRERFMT